MNLFIDDIRPCPGGYKLARDSVKAKRLLSTFTFDHVSFDNDLGLDSEEGWQIINWLENEIREGRITKPGRITCHSMNPVAKKRIMETAQKISEL